MRVPVLDRSSAGKSLVGLCRLARPLNAAMMAIGVAIGAVLAGGSAVLASGDVWVAMLAAAAIGTGANAINDVFDCEIDRVNRPSRPLPSGTVSVQTARWLWGVASLSGVVLAITLSWVHAAVAIGSVALLYLYSATLKRRVLVGNLAVAVVVALALVFGGLQSLLDGHGTAMSLLAGAVFAFLTTLAREIAKDIEDVPGDARSDARTLPVAAGVRPAAITGTAVILLTLAALPAARLFGLPSSFLALSLPAGAALVLAAWWLLGSIVDDADTGLASAGRASAGMKVAMLAGLAALAIVAW